MNTTMLLNSSVGMGKPHRSYTGPINRDTRKRIIVHTNRVASNAAMNTYPRGVQKKFKRNNLSLALCAVQPTHHLTKDVQFTKSTSTPSEIENWIFLPLRDRQKARAIREPLAAVLTKTVRTPMSWPNNH